jgi:pimeloyl-ACP methyl ester carboxylesterase
MRSVIVLAFWLGGCAFEGESLELAIDPDAQARCEASEARIDCAKTTVTFATGAFGLAAREVHLMHPVGEPPADGWPAVVMFQGSFFSADGTFSGERDGEFGDFHEARTVMALLDAGYAVIAPEARYDGATFWDTNVVPYSFAWDTSEDHQLMVELLDAIDRGALGPIDPSALFAAGISSGGYMTSRMAVSYAGRFRALAIQSASYATCGGALCDVPELPHDHPPTLFLHGGDDLVVPARTAEDYAAALAEQGTEARVVIDESAGHAWVEAAPEEIVAWLAAHGRLD